MNNYSTIPDCSDTFEYVKCLHLADNDISSWKEVEKLSRPFNRLQSLILCHNPIVTLSDCDSKAFASLEKLSLSNTQIENWECLDKLHHFPALADARIVDIPLLCDIECERRWKLLIARLPRLKSINGTEVCDGDREEAERMFIRTYKDESEKPTRYTELVEKHGELGDLVNVKIGKKEIVQVTIQGDVERSQMIQLDLDKTVGDLLKQVCELYSLKLTQFRLLFNDRVAEKQVVMRTKTERLTRYYMSDGDSIMLERLDINNWADDPDDAEFNLCFMEYKEGVKYGNAKKYSKMESMFSKFQ